jgi:CcmD family protein
MSDLFYLFAAFAVLWIGVLGYLIRLAGLRKQLEEKIDRLQDRMEKNGFQNG